jgi:nucleoside-diphosphate kinase
MSTATKEKTLAVIKPGAFKSRHTGAIITDIQARGFIITEMRLVRFSDEQAKEFYKEHAGRAYFQGLIDHQTSGPAVVLVLEGPVNGPSVIKTWRDAMGPTDPSLGQQHHLRSKYGYGMPGNALHGSDSPEAFAREYEVVFEWTKVLARQVAAAAEALCVPAATPDANELKYLGPPSESAEVAPAPGASETAGS